MRKTRFAGLTVVAPDETISVDNSSFQSVNPDIIDHFLEVGAVTHRHDGHAPLGDPLAQASGTVVAAGGTIGADVTVYVGYTLVDQDGGETRLSPALALTTDPPYEAPTSPIDPTVTYASGALRSDTYYYAITLMDGGGGETPIGPVVSVDRQPGPAFASIALDGLRRDMVAYDAVGWRLYRATAGQQLGYLASGTVDRFVDAGQGCVDCGQAPPSENRTNRTNKIVLVAPGSGQAAGSGVPGSGAASFRLYASVDGAFNTDCLVNEYPAASAGVQIEVPSLVLRPGRPPDVSTSVRGASRLNAETDLANYYWRGPVAGSALLPADLPGTTRRALDTMEVFVAGSGAAAGGAGWLRAGSAMVRRIGVTGQQALEVEEIQIRGSGAVRAVSVTRSGAGRGSGEVLIDWRPELYEPLSSGAAALTYDTGGPNGLLPFPASGGAQPTGAGERRFHLEGSYDDAEGMIRFRPVGSTNGTAGVVFRANGGTGLIVRANGIASQLEVVTVAGAVLGAAAIPALAVAGDYTVRGVALGNRVLAELYDRPPSPGDARVAPVARFTVEIPRALRPFIGSRVRGAVGGQVIAGSLAWVISDLRFREANRSLTIGDGTRSMDDPLAITLVDGLRLESDAQGSALIRDRKHIGRVSTFGNGQVDDVRALDFRGLDGTITSLVDLGGGSARVEITASGGGGGAGGFVQRQWASASMNLASGASGLAGLDLGIGYRIYKIHADRPARARFYAGSGYQLADRARPLGADPVNDHGVMLDFFLNTDLSWAMTPLVDGANLEEVPVPAIPVTITNHGAAGVVTVAVLYARTE